MPEGNDQGAGRSDAPPHLLATRMSKRFGGVEALRDVNYMGNNNAEPPNVLVAKINDTVAAEGTLALERWWEAVPADVQGEAVAEFNRFMLNPTMETAEEVMANIQEVNAEYWDSQ